MDSGAVDSPITLVIKAPDQKYDYQTINCFLNWTVEKLKSHISNVYPSKPQDEYHMIHLVCASRSPPESPTPSSRSPTTRLASSPASHPSTSSMAPDSTGFTSWATMSNQNSPHVPSSTFSPPEAGPDDSLRHRRGFPQHSPYILTSTGVMQCQAAVLASLPSSANLPSLSSPSPSPQPAQPNKATAPLGPNPGPNHIPEHQPANPNIQMNAQDGATMNEDELDWMYTVSRAAILICFVYFYSSFSRFVMVVGAMLLVYLTDFQDPRAGGGGGGGGGGRGGWGVAQQVEGERHHDIQEMERIMDEGMEDEEDESGGEAAAEDEAALHHLGFLFSAWSFIGTFFTSLVPERRPHPAN